MTSTQDEITRAENKRRTDNIGTMTDAQKDAMLSYLSGYAPKAFDVAYNHMISIGIIR